MRHAYNIHASEVHAFEMHALWNTRPYEMHASEGFCEDLARQNAVAQLPQLQVRFWRRHIWVSVIAVVS